MTLQTLTECFENAIKGHNKFIAVQVTMEGFPRPEVIINQTANFEAKLEYYQNAYNDDLTLRSYPAIKITGYIASDSYAEIELVLGKWEAANG